MALIWIVTIGNSDVKLTSNDGWGRLRESKRSALNPCYYDFSAPTAEADGLLSLPARVLGIIYGDALETHWDYFRFPLLSAFTEEIKSDKKNKPDRIIVLLTDQTKIFSDSNDNSRYDRSDSDCPYWKDTHELKPILKEYFDGEFGKNKVEFSTLEPRHTDKGLDHWDETLKLIQKEFLAWKITKTDRVIVSHQAGTPAISSAVQLTALIQFGKKVSFLVSNEFFKGKAKLLSGSSYFSTLQIQEAQQLLSRFDYAGVNRSLEKIDFDTSDQEEKLNYIFRLLELADLWNAAKFNEFAQKLKESEEFKDFNRKLNNTDKLQSDTWWWKGYEMAYLASIRMRQENPTEALFHSVRAIEGLICEWAIDKHSPHIHYKFIELDENSQKVSKYKQQRFQGQKEGSPIAKKSIDNRFKNFLQYENQRNSLDNSKLGLYGQNLYALFRSTFESSFISDIETHSIKIVWEELADIRNELFHQLKGITQEQVYEAWGCDNPQKWEKILFNCIELVSNTKGEGFKSLKRASLMSSIHDQIEHEINDLIQKQNPA